MTEQQAIFHWSPIERRERIKRRGLVPGSPSTDRLWKPPYVCFSYDPQLAWSLSGRMRKGEFEAWDLWMTWASLLKGFEEIYDTYEGQPYVKEIRVYERVFKRDLWYVASREG